MAAMNSTDRGLVRGDYTRTETGSFGAVTKADLLAAVNALDDFLVTNATAINNAIPLPARTVLTQTQKARLLMIVIRKRYDVGS